MKLIKLPESGIFINPDNILFIVKNNYEYDPMEIAFNWINSDTDTSINLEYTIKFVSSDINLRISRNDMTALMASGASEWNP